MKEGLGQKQQCGGDPARFDPLELVQASQVGYLTTW